ncbi:hypothetical protein LPJ81_000347 [Coemansia sp. IMI 209127]|nr:hypothetical protein LPJ81_000347 [Coemansia sp. IMI 209127]
MELYYEKSANSRIDEATDDVDTSSIVVDYEGGISIDGTVTYKQIGDDLGIGESGIMRKKVVNGNIVVLTI